MRRFPIFFLASSAFLYQCGPKTNADKAPHQNLALVQEAAPQEESNSDPQDDVLKTEVDALLSLFRDIYAKEDSHVPDTSLSDLKKPKYVKFSDVKNWKLAGDEYAVGYDANGKLLAIYDLTYQNTRSLEFIGRSILGTIGVGDLNLRELIRIIRKAIQQRQNDSDFSSNEFSGPMNKNQFDKVYKVLDKVEKRYGDYKSPLVGDWWTQLPIKKELQNSVDAKVSFRLSDIDYEKTMTKQQAKEFRKHLEKLQKDISDLFNIDTVHLLDELTLQHNSNGSYNLVLSPITTLAPDAQPDKVVDFVRYQSSFGYALLYLAIKSGLENLTSAIPQPVVAAVLKYAICRWFELYEEQLSFHRFRAYEYINEAERNDASPFSFLNADERARGGVYVLSHEASIIHTIFKPRNEAYFHQSIKTELELVQKNTAWTNKKNLTLSPLSSLYFYGMDSKTSSKDYLLAMGGRPRFAKTPFVAVNYKKPHLERYKRNTLKSIYDLLQAVKLPYPGISFLMTTLYDVFILDDIRDAMRWEARLVSLMNNSPGKDYTKELEWIYSQRVNPFEFDNDEEKVFVQRSKSYIGL